MAKLFVEYGADVDATNVSTKYYLFWKKCYTHICISESLQPTLMVDVMLLLPTCLHGHYFAKCPTKGFGLAR